MIGVGNVLALFLFSMFVLLSALTVMNMLIGVLCQVVLEVSAEEGERQVKKNMSETLLVMLQELDDDNSGELSRSEFRGVICEPKALAVMKDIQVDTQHLLDLTEMIYPTDETTVP